MEELELDMYLQSIIQDACSHLPDSPQRRKAINRLLRSIHTSGGIQRHGNEIYERALYATMLNLTNTLCARYDSDRGSFLTWFRACLRNQYRDELRAEQRYRSRHKSLVRSDQGESDPLELILAPTDGKLLLDTWESFVKWIADDPDNLLKACHIEHNPKANCQSIAYLKLVMGKEWQEIALEVGSPSGTISSHWNRKCQPLLQEWFEQNQKLF